MPEFGRGTFVGRYVILDRLGEGGMGVVYRAYDPDLDRRVALKLVRDLSADATARLVHEAQALAKVSHPNIIQVFDVGVFGDTVFIAMELVEGKTLSRWHRETQQSWRATLAQLVDAGRGLAAAHAAGLVHRDFKPQNVIVGVDGRVRVLDFGLARLSLSATRESGELDGLSSGSWPSPSWSSSAIRATERPTSSGESHTTPTALEIPHPRVEADTEPDDDEDLPHIVVSRVIGTPVYMAPEQRRRGVIDSRADQFAFAVTCWELLHGERPFVGERAEYVESAAKGRFRPPPVGNDTPTWVRRVLLRALSASPAQRYRSMEELLAALAADPARRSRQIAAIVLATGAAAAVAVALAMRAAGPTPCEDAARHLDGVWDASVAARLDAAFRATGAGFAADTARTVRSALYQRATAWKSMHREACRATRVSGEQSAALLDLRIGCLARRRDEMRAVVGELLAAPDVERVATSVEAVSRLPAVSACADRDALTAVVPLPVELAKRAVIGELRSELAAIKALMWTGQWTKGRALAERVEARARELGWAPLVAEASFVRGLTERNAGSMAVAEASLTEAVHAAARAHLDDLVTAGWGELAWVVGYEQSRPLEGLALASAAEVAAMRSEAPPVARASVAHARAIVLSRKGDHAAALREAGRALALFTTSREAELEAADVLNTIAMIRSDQGDYKEAEQAHRQVLARRQAALGDAHPKIADSIDNLGVVLYHQGAYDEARRHYEWALSRRVAALGAEHRDVGTSHNNLGSLLMETGDSEGAARHLESALRIYERVFGASHADLAIPLSNLGELAVRKGDHDRGVAYCERALAIDKAASGPDDPKLAYDLVCIGEAELGRGRLSVARDVLERALKLREGSEGDAIELARTQFDLAQVLWLAGGAPQRAMKLATQARDGLAAAGDAGKARHADVSAWLAKSR